jgi:hypothetical protein
MSTLTVVVLVIILLVLLLVATGLIAARRRDARQAGEYRRHVTAADEALELARAADKGWDRDALETAAREALEQARPEWLYDELHLVFVEDREGVEEDRAHFMAVGPDGEARVVLARRDSRWSAERVE